MNNIYTKNGRLNFPIEMKLRLPEEKFGHKDGQVVIHEAYCQNGHNIMCDEQIINGQESIHFIYQDLSGENEAELAVSAIVGDTTKKICRGNPYQKGQQIRVLCPHCRSELPVLLNCKCAAPIYIFYLDKNLRSNYAQSFCSRIGCIEASRLRFSADLLRDYINEYSF